MTKTTMSPLFVSTAHKDKFSSTPQVCWNLISNYSQKTTTNLTPTGKVYLKIFPNKMGKISFDVDQKENLSNR